MKLFHLILFFFYSYFFVFGKNQNVALYSICSNEFLIDTTNVTTIPISKSLGTLFESNLQVLNEKKICIYDLKKKQFVVWDTELRKKIDNMKLSFNNANYEYILSLNKASNKIITIGFGQRNYGKIVIRNFGLQKSKIVYALRFYVDDLISIFGNEFKPIYKISETDSILTIYGNNSIYQLGLSEYFFKITSKLKYVSNEKKELYKFGYNSKSMSIYSIDKLSFDSNLVDNQFLNVSLRNIFEKTDSSIFFKFIQDFQIADDKNEEYYKYLILKTSDSNKTTFTFFDRSKKNFDLADSFSISNFPSSNLLFSVPFSSTDSSFVFFNESLRELNYIKLFKHELKRINLNNNIIKYRLIDSEFNSKKVDYFLSQETEHPCTLLDMHQYDSLILYIKKKWKINIDFDKYFLKDNKLPFQTSCNLIYSTPNSNFCLTSNSSDTFFLCNSNANEINHKVFKYKICENADILFEKKPVPIACHYGNYLILEYAPRTYKLYDLKNKSFIDF